MTTEPQTNAPPKLLVEGVHKTFYKETRDGVQAINVLNGINLSVPAGEFVTVIGPSGCGKSTLLRIIDGLIAPDLGRVVVDGKQVTGPGADRAVVFQYFGLYPWRTVLKNVEFGLEVQGVAKAERREKAMENIALVGLKDFEHHFPHELSGGMRQRVGLARALTTGADVILMDEPFSAVDEQTREILQEQLLELWARTRKTIIFITHSIDEAVYMANRIVVMGTRPGRIVETIDVHLPQPRTSEMRMDPEFGQIRTHAWDFLRRSIQEAKILEAS